MSWLRTPALHHCVPRISTILVFLRLNLLGQRKLPMVFPLSGMLCLWPLSSQCASPNALNVNAACQALTDPGCKSLQYLGTGPDLEWMNGKNGAFLLWKRYIFQIFGLQLDLSFTFEKSFGVWLDLDWVLKIRTGSGSQNMTVRSSLLQTFDTTEPEVCMDWILDFLDPDSGCDRQDPDSGFLNKNRTRTGFGFCNLLMKNGLWDWAVPVIANYV